MRFDQVAISLDPRTTANCLDLALLILRRQARPLLALWALIAIPACTLTYILVDQFQCSLWTGLLIFLVTSSPLGVLAVMGVAPSMFGEPFTARDVWRRMNSGGWRLLVTTQLLRIGAIFAGTVLCVIPGALLAVRYGFLTEQFALANLSKDLFDSNLKDLIKAEFSDLCARSVWITLFCGLLWVSLFMLADMVGYYVLFGMGLVTGRLSVDTQYRELDEAFATIVDFIWHDARVVAALLACGLLVYVLGRLAWFLVYIDLRVRRDCWDMELQIVHEAERLEAV
ncbi:MAG: hypothetical protein HZA46_00940 [Planctomycetales bacterium]|nr:hypothetical protein [Planctomycetales bacterium]